VPWDEKEKREEQQDSGRTIWRRPYPQWMTYPSGRRIPVYVCPHCRDMGIVSLPKEKPEEKDEDLVRVFIGAGVAYICPKCRPDEAKRRLYVPREDRGTPQEEIASAPYHRLLRWMVARTEQLKVYGQMEEDYERHLADGGARMKFDVGRLAKGMGGD
jgi:hypothetical protein